MEQRQPLVPALVGFTVAAETEDNDATSKNGGVVVDPQIVLNVCGVKTASASVKRWLERLRPAKSRVGRM